MPDDHSELVPPLPIPNRTVKRLCADDSAATSVKVGYRQASYKEKTRSGMSGFFFVCYFIDCLLTNEQFDKGLRNRTWRNGCL